MKFIHTADLHIGRRLNDIPLLDDQRHILNQIAGIVQIWKDNDNMALYPTQKYKNIIKH